jgi:quinol monooxygenase YgiN
VIGILIRAQVEADQRHELMQTCKRWLASNYLPAACLEKRVYQDAISPKHLVLVEEWLDKEAMNSHLSSDQFRALIGAIKVLGKLVDIRTSETTVIEAGDETGHERGGSRVEG